MLLLDDCLTIAGQALTVGVMASDLPVDPAQRRLVLGKLLDEVGPRHTALVDHEILNLALDLANVIDLATHAVAQPFDLACGKANLHELGGNLFL